MDETLLLRHLVRAGCRNYGLARESRILLLRRTVLMRVHAGQVGIERQGVPTVGEGDFRRRLPMLDLAAFVR